MIYFLGLFYYQSVYSLKISTHYMKRNWYHIPFTLGCLMSIWLCHWNIPSLVCPYLFWTLKSRTRIFIRMGDTTWHLRALVLVDNLIIISSTHIGQPIETHSLSFKEIQHFFWAQRPSVYMWYHSGSSRGGAERRKRVGWGWEGKRGGWWEGG